MVVKEIIKGVAFGISISLAMAIALPVVFAVARPATKSAIRGYLSLRDAVARPRSGSPRGRRAATR